MALAAIRSDAHLFRPDAKAGIVGLFAFRIRRHANSLRVVNVPGDAPARRAAVSEPQLTSVNEDSRIRRSNNAGASSGTLKNVDEEEEA